MSEARVDADIVPLVLALVVAAWGTAELVPAEGSPVAEMVGWRR